MADKRQAEVAVHHESHGNSVAAWTGVAIIAVGFLCMTLAVVLRMPVLFIVGIVVIVVGVVAGKTLSAMGFGVSGRPGH